MDSLRRLYPAGFKIHRTEGSRGLEDSRVSTYSAVRREHPVLAFQRETKPRISLFGVLRQGVKSSTAVGKTYSEAGVSRAGMDGGMRTTHPD